MEKIKSFVLEIVKNAKSAVYDTAQKSTLQKNAALKRIAEDLLKNTEAILVENQKDIEYSNSIGKNKAIIERLTLTSHKIKQMADAVMDIMTLPDPIGSGSHITTRPNGLKIQKIRVPLGVVLMIFESRPNVTTDAAALCIKSGNTVILRGGKEAIFTNTILAKIIRRAIKELGFSENAVQMIDKTEHQIVDELLKQDKWIDVVIPRGGEELIKAVIEKSKIPVIKHDKGVCHVFVDADANRDKAEKITVNAKVQRPSVCNAIETLLIHKDYPYKHELLLKLLENKVEIIGDEETQKIMPGIKEATEEDWFTEYLDYKISVRIVNTHHEAIEHINHYGSHHSDSNVSENYTKVQDFLSKVDSAVVYANASTRFTDGGEFGLGAEIGISTQKLHVRGPMGLEGLTCEKWVVYGEGQIR